MWDFLIRNFVVKNAQNTIDRLEPKPSLHVPSELPLPSIRVLKKLSGRVAAVNAREKEMQAFSDEELKQKTAAFRERYHVATGQARAQLDELERKTHQATTTDEREDLNIQIGKLTDEFKKIRRAALDEMLPEAFAVVREVSWRLLRMRHFDVQLAGGIVLHEGKIAEMATGEGKTLVATLPAYLNGLTGDGVHVVTVNDYLAKRDCEWMAPIFEFLGLSVGVILHDMMPSQRQAAYGCDITYGTNNEFGFDYLRDNMVNRRQDMVQRQPYFAIVDEVDSILIDEARTPLIISGPAEESTDKYYKANEASRHLNGRRIIESEQIEAKYRNEDIGAGYDYIADEKAKSIALTDDGEVKGAKLLGVDNLHEMETVEYRHHILQALRAKEFFKRDVDYVVRDGEVIIVDEFTGRMMPGRRWSDGLHQAVEAREGIRIERENQTLATITFQNYFRMYEKLSGMTGTAYTEANEFEQIYNLECVVMPTNRVLQRKNYTDCIYRTASEKFAAVVEEIAEYHQRGQPVLVGTISIEKSEYLSSLLKQKGVPHQVLNAKYHEMEANIVAQAGRYKAVTIATNMAGRGTDIVLGGNAEFLARALADEKAGDDEDPDAKEALIQKFLQQFREQVKAEHEKVVQIGGLHVLATERHESRRIDNQLRGRSGRQGDPGSSRFFVSLEDDLMRLFASDRIMSMMDRLGMEEGQVIEHPWVSRALEVAQKRVENHNFEIRKHLLEYDNVMNKQREAIYSLRRSVLESDSVRDRVLEAIDDTVYGMVEQYLYAGQEEVAWDIEGLDVYLKTKFLFDLGETRDELKNLSPEQIRERIGEGLKELYARKETEIPPEHLRRIERFLLLHIIDAKWKDHLYAMDQLKESVSLRSYAQRDPLVEYKREGFAMFQMMFASINAEYSETIFKVQSAGEPSQERPRGVFSSLPQKLVHNEFSSLSGPSQGRNAPSAAPLGRRPSRAESAAPESKPEPVQRTTEKVGRNDPCPCGSGKKHKKCCGR